MATKRTSAIGGWHFEKGDSHYYVGASTAADAAKYLTKHDDEIAKTKPKSISAGLVRFFELRNGKIISGRVVERGNV